MALELERTRELGLLLVETELTGLIASLLLVPVGVGIAATLVYVLYERCFGWSMDPTGSGDRGARRRLGAALLAGVYPACPELTGCDPAQ